MDTLFVAMEWISVPYLLVVVIWAVAVRPPRRAIKNAVLYVAFGLAATFALLVFAMQVRDFGALIVGFILMMFVSYFVAQKLDQI
jgi:hypothetical protein